MRLLTTFTYMINLRLVYARAHDHKAWPVLNMQGVVTHVHCTDTRDRGQNLIGPILGLDRFIPARKVP